MNIKEKGAAEIRVKLEDSTITVYHFDGTELFSRPAVAGDWGRIWLTLKPLQLTPQSLNAFLEQPGINLTGVCKEAGITKQHLNRCRKDGALPGEKVMDKLLPVLTKYGY